MKADEFRAVRKRLGLSRDEIAEVLGLSGYNAVSNIELGLRNPSRLAQMLLRALDSLPAKQAKSFMDLLRRHKA